MRQLIHIGIDDTDSISKGCTTHIAALLIERLEKLGVEFVDFPNLIRLNPNVPWKTRGNGALCLRFTFRNSVESEIKNTVVDLVEQFSDMKSEGTDPGIVFFEGKVPENLKEFSKKAETAIVTLNSATKLIKNCNAEAVGYNTCRGIIGALAAIGEELEADHTYELIAYRKPENFGTKRKVDKDSVLEMDKQTSPNTFNNFDTERNRVVITPHGPDPILLGIRGESAEIVKRSFAMVNLLEPVERWVVFRTNQGTDAHLKHASKLADLIPNQSFISRATVSRNPRALPGRHVIFGVKDSSHEVDCAAYEETGRLRKIANQLLENDKIEIYGAVRPPRKNNPLTVNLEKLRVIAVAPKFFFKNPTCEICGKRSKSLGKGQGYRCKNCRTKLSIDRKILIEQKRLLEPGLYFTSTGSLRHLTKPFRRYGLEKTRFNSKELINDWHS